MLVKMLESGLETPIANAHKGGGGMFFFFYFFFFLGGGGGYLRGFNPRLSQC